MRKPEIRNTALALVLASIKYYEGEIKKIYDNFSPDDNIVGLEALYALKDEEEKKALRYAGAAW